MYGTYKLPAYRQNSKTRQKKTRQKGREISTHSLILMENTARQTQTFVDKFAPSVPIVTY